MPIDKRDVTFHHGLQEIDKATTYADRDVKFHLHLQEAEDMKKKWFSYVFDNIQSLHDKVESSTLQIEKERAYIMESTAKLKEQVFEEIQKSSLSQDKELEKVEMRIEKVMDNLSRKLDCINVSDIRIEMDECVQTTKSKLEEAFDEFKLSTDLKIHALSTEHTVLKTKLWVYTAMMSVVMTAITTSIVGSCFILFKNVLKKWLEI